ncbi:MAG: DUF1573 domain-containing protein [Planctomycetaceae bacterium]
MGRLLEGLSLVLLLLIVAVGGWSMAARRGTAVLSAAPVQVSGLDFGRVAEQREFQHRIWIQNVGTAPVTLSNIRGSCRCTRLEPSQVTVLPGDTASVDLVIDLLPSDAVEATRSIREFSAQLIAEVDDGIRNIRSWRLTGTVERRVVVEPPAIIFGGSNPLVVGGGWPTLSARITAHDQNAELELVATPLRYDWLSCTLDKQSQGEWLLSVTPAPTDQIGSFNAMLRARLILPGQQPVPVVVPVSGEVTSEIQPHPRA